MAFDGQGNSRPDHHVFHVTDFPLRTMGACVVRTNDTGTNLLRRSTHFTVRVEAAQTLPRISNRQ
jgi:hypothetical protein